MKSTLKINRSQQVCITLLSIFLSATSILLGQPRQLPPHGFGSGPMLPGESERIVTQYHLNRKARVALDANNYTAAEDYARQSLSLGQGAGVSQKILALALMDQDKDEEALHLYKVMIVDEKDDDQDDMVAYATLLLRVGDWAQAAAVYNAVVPRIVNADILVTNSHFSPSVPQPKRLEIALHIAQGVLDQHSTGWGYHVRLGEGMREFTQARQLQPDAALANYYYGYGLKGLGRRAEAQAAFRKAAALGQGDMKKAAQKEFPETVRPK